MTALCTVVNPNHQLHFFFLPATSCVSGPRLAPRLQQEAKTPGPSTPWRPGTSASQSPKVTPRSSGICLRSPAAPSACKPSPCTGWMAFCGLLWPPLGFGTSQNQAKPALGARDPVCPTSLPMAQFIVGLPTGLHTVTGRLRFLCSRQTLKPANYQVIYVIQGEFLASLVPCSFF